MIKIVILDPGHGGLDSNGVYTTAPGKMFKFKNGDIAYEGVLNREIMTHLHGYLKYHEEFKTIHTVEADDATDLPLKSRVQIANKYNSKETLFISIHCNAGGGTGFEIFTTVGKTKSDKLAQGIGEELLPLFGEYNVRFRKDLSDGDLDKESNFYVLRKTKCPAVLLECGFFDNEVDYALLINVEYQSRLAYRIYLGIIQYIETNEK